MSDRLRSLNSLGDIEFAVKRIEELEAKLEEAVRALVELNEVAKRAIKLSQEYDEFRLYAMEPMCQATALANTTLAELTGGKDE